MIAQGADKHKQEKAAISPLGKTILNGLRCALTIVQGKYILIFEVLKRLRAFQNLFFTEGVVAGNGSFRAGFPLSLLTAFAASSPKGTPSHSLVKVYLLQPDGGGHLKLFCAKRATARGCAMALGMVLQDVTSRRC